MGFDDWRRPNRWVDSLMKPQPSAAKALDGKAADLHLDAFKAAAEWCQAASDPEVQAIGARMDKAVASILRGDKDDEGRAVPVGRIIGVQPSFDQSATQIIALRRRNKLLREARASVPEWSAMAATTAAAAMIDSFERYQAGSWQADRHRETAPAIAPQAIWWRLLKLDITKPCPGKKRLSDLIKA